MKSLINHFKKIRTHFLIFLYLVMATSLLLIYLFRDEQPIMITFIVFGIVSFIAISFISGTKKEKSNLNKEKIIKSNRKKIYDYVNANKSFSINEQSYNKLILKDKRVILETTDWSTFVPRSHKKRGRKLHTYKEAEVYLNKIKN